MTDNETFAKLPYVPVPRAPQVRRAIEALGGLITLDTRVQGRRAADVPAEELAGLLAGIVDLMVFGIDPDQQPREMAALVQGYAQATGGRALRSERDALYLSALGLKASLSGRLLSAGAEAAYLGQSSVGKAGTTVAAAKLSEMAGELVLSAVGVPSLGPAEIADELRKIADALDSLAKNEMPAT